MQSLPDTFATRKQKFNNFYVTLFDRNFNASIVITPHLWY